MALKLSGQHKRELAAARRRRKMPEDLALRLEIIWQCGQGLSCNQVAGRLGIAHNTVRKWRARYEQGGLAALGDLPRPGRPRTCREQRVSDLLRRTIETRPEGASHWSARSFALAHGVSKSTVWRLWKEFGLAPHRAESFKLSDDPEFVDKLVDIAGLYLQPPAKALVLCVDEKSQIQALERTQPGLPMGLGYAEGYTHDYVRHGTTTLFAALEVASGKFLAACKQGHRHEQFLEFLRQIDASTPGHLDLHLVVDNYATHKHPRVRTWLARHRRFHLHFTPTYSSWLNQVEIFFGIITRRAIRRGSFASVKQLVAAIERFVQAYNAQAKPFAWTPTSNSILTKLERLTSRICGK